MGNKRFRIDRLTLLLILAIIALLTLLFYFIIRDSCQAGATVTPLPSEQPRLLNTA